MGDLGLDPETALKLIQVILRGAAYFFAGFALLGLSTYVVFLCLEIFASQRRAKVRIAKVPQPVGCAPAAEQNHDLIFAEAPIPAEEEYFPFPAEPAPERSLGSANHCGNRAAADVLGE